MKLTKFRHFIFIALAVIAIDQLSKWLAFEFLREYDDRGNHVGGETLRIFGDWFSFQYETNPGMAFGLRINAWWGKIVLTLFRLGAMFAIIWYMKKLWKTNAHKGLLICIALILAGAVGNLVDSTFYGLLSDDLLVKDAPFALFHGEVIDFVYINMGVHWGYHFWPIFNIADSSIFVAVAIILIRQKAFFASLDKKKNDTEAPQSDIETPTTDTSEAKEAVSTES